MELWSNVEKERAAQQELVAFRVTRQARPGPTSAADQIAIDLQAAAGLKTSTGLTYEATPLKTSNSNAASGKERQYQHSSGEHAAEPATPEAQASSLSTLDHKSPVCHGSSMAGENKQAQSRPGVEGCCQESTHAPGDGCKHDLGGTIHDIQALEDSAGGKPQICRALQDKCQKQSVSCANHLRCFRPALILL